ncbi:Uncharacterised protein [Mycobacteroides abscessus subsp. massiliense]|nr:Uncharacterised protein [Mycobacteroides abscessus subsp. massiliense]
MRVKTFHVLDRLIGCGGRADLHPDRVGDDLGERDMRMIELPSAVADPQVVRRQVIQRGVTVLVLTQAQHRAFVVEHQRFVAGVDLRGVQVRIDHTAGTHELQTTIDLAGQRLVPGPGRRGADEFAVPVVHEGQ